MAFTLRRQRIDPGGEVFGEVRLCGGADPVVVDRLRARLSVRVYADFDDDDGARHVRLFDGTIAEAACEQSGLQWETDLAYPGSQQIESRLPAMRSRPKVVLTWRVHRRWVTVELYGHRRPPFSLRLTHAQATRVDWADQLSGWLTTTATRAQRD
jgi:sporulation-control protein spo0M